MSADLPLEEPPGRLSEPAGPRDPDVYNRTYRRWDVYFAIVFAATFLFVLSGSDLGTGPRVVAVAFFAATAPWYVLVGRAVLLTEGEDQPRAVAYLVGLFLLFVVPSALVGETRIAIFALTPQCFMLLRMRRALIAVTVINIAPVVVWALVERPDSGDLFFNSLFAAVSCAFSLLIGSWIIMVLQQSAERARLIAELDASREEVARLSAAHGALAERDRLSREIHDTLAQGFTSLLMLVQAVESELDHDMPLARGHLGLMARTARENLAEARALVAGAGPADLDGSSLPDALRRLAARHGEQTNSPARVEVSGAVRPLPAAVEVVALRGCQEALANARRHAGPGAAVTIALGYGEDALRLRVEDTGRGFDPRAPREGYGLTGLRARAAEVGGTAEVAAAPGEGTAVALELPVRPPAPLPHPSRPTVRTRSAR
ncbi:sensor histidine kinase [Streptomyces malaysiensis]|uniref:Signal transduction histidine kinase n=1 Tax=Streptomyces malaysiensis TaxID=92644 RepID=A0A7X6B1P4_STRMQ|nr:sensor histidine kinase [Streptomyces malaysiensis]NIY69831.1 signal transduction histidine kinase [Streptomyces malaysiensis]